MGKYFGLFYFGLLFFRTAGWLSILVLFFLLGVAFDILVLHFFHDTAGLPWFNILVSVFFVWLSLEIF